MPYIILGGTKDLGLTDAHGQAARDEGALLQSLKVVGAHDEGVADGAALIDEGSQAHHRVLHDAAAAHGGAVPDDAAADVAVGDLAGGQEAGHRVDGRVFVVEAARNRMRFQASNCLPDLLLGENGKFSC